MTYRYIATRHHSRIEWAYDTLDEALNNIVADLEFMEAWPIALYEGETLIADNGSGEPWVHGSCPLNEMALKWWRDNHPYDEETDDER